MIRLLYVSTSTTVGGAEKTLYTLATLINPQAYELAGIVSLKPQGPYARKLEEAGAHVHSLDLKKTPGLKDIQRLAVLINEIRPQIVHAIMYQAIQLCRAVRRLGYADFKLVSSPRVHYRTRSSFSLLVDRFLKDFDDILVTECEASRKYLIENRGYPAEKIIKIYNGAELAGCQPSAAVRRKLREKLGLGEETTLLGAVGRLDEQKGHIYLLEAVAKLRTTHPIKCIIIGEGPLRPLLEDRIRKLRIDEDVRLLGEQADVPDWLCAIDIFVQPSLWEGLPNALLEAMALGLPVVAARVDGIPEVVDHEITGLLCNPKDSQSIFVRVQDLLSDPELRRRVGEGARQMILNNFKLTDMIQSYEAVYSRLIPS